MTQGMEVRGTAESVFIGLRWEILVLRHPVMEELAQVWYV